MRPLLDQIATERVESLLDAGCGDGMVTRRIAESLRGLRRLVGVDRDPMALDEAGDHLRALEPEVQVDLLVGDIMAFGFDVGEFDAVALCDVLHHLDRPGDGTAECFRVLRPGGMLIFSEMVTDDLSPAEQVGRDLHHIKAGVDRLNGIPHGETLSREALTAMITTAGFELQWTRVERHPSIDPRDPYGKQLIDSERQFIEDYMQHAENSPEYASLRRAATRLFYRLDSIGVASAPSLLLVAQRPE